MRYFPINFHLNELADSIFKLSDFVLGLLEFVLILALFDNSFNRLNKSIKKGCLIVKDRIIPSHKRSLDGQISNSFGRTGNNTKIMLDCLLDPRYLCAVLEN